VWLKGAGSRLCSVVLDWTIAAAHLVADIDAEPRQAGLQPPPANCLGVSACLGMSRANSQRDLTDSSPPVFHQSRLASILSLVLDSAVTSSLLFSTHGSSGSFKRNRDKGSYTIRAS
jgi:hypothetical protein